MRKYFTLWRCGYSDWKLHPAKKAIKEALQAENSPEIRARIEQYAQYVHYLQLLAAYHNAGRGERAIALRELIEAGSRIAPTNMAHSAPLIGRFLPAY